MATRNSKVRRAKEIVPRDPLTLTRPELDELIRDCEQKADRLEAFQGSEEWRLMRKRLEARRDRLEHEMKGLRRRLLRPVAGQPVVTLEQIAGHEARIQENAELIQFPKITVALWRGQIDDLRALRARSA